MNGNQQQDEAGLQQMEQQKRTLLARLLSKDAYERLARVRLANPQLAAQLEMYLLQLAQSGKLREQVTDRKLKEVLQILTAESGRKSSIRRR